MKRNIIYILIFGFNSFCIAQHRIIDYDKNQKPGIVNLNGTGIVISIIDNKKTDMAYLNNELDTLWEVNLESKHKNLVIIKQINDPIEPYNFTVVSPSKNIFNNVQIKRNGFYNKPHYITTINKKGEKKEFEVIGQEEFGKNLISAFCDDEFLYYISSEDGREMHKKKKQTEKLVLNRFDARDLSHKKIIISTPNVLNEHSTFWSYLGQSNQEKFLLSKNIDPKKQKVNLNVIAFNKEGEILRKFDIDFYLKGNFIRPAFIVNNDDLSYQAINFDHYIVPATAQTSRSRTAVTSGGFAGFIFDENSKSFYLYGLMGPKAFKKVGSTYNGYYISKYDIEGNLEWSIQEPVSRDLADDKYFKVHARPADRAISLRISPIGNLNIIISGKDSDYNHIISSQGTYLGVKKNGFIYNSADQVLESEKYIKGIDSKKERRSYYKHFLIGNGEVLLERQLDGFSLLFF